MAGRIKLGGRGVIHAMSCVTISSRCCVLSCPTEGYIGEFEIVDDHRSGKIVVFLNGRLNKCAVISPRFDVSLNEIEKWASNLLPSRQFG